MTSGSDQAAFRTTAPPHAWFERRDLGGGLELICEPYVHPWFRCNIWLIRGRDCDLVIDAGMGLQRLRPVLDLTPDKPVIAVATHAHVDHIGSLHEFEDRRAHVAEAGAYATMPDAVTLADHFRAQPEPVSAPPHAGWSPADFRLEPAPLRATLEAGDVIDLGDWRFRLLHLPGHSPDSIGLFDEARGIVFTGDALYDGQLLDDLPHSNVRHYVQTMALLGSLSIKMGHGGHGPSFSNERKLTLVEEYLAGKRVQGCPGQASSGAASSLEAERV